MMSQTKRVPGGMAAVLLLAFAMIGCQAQKKQVPGPPVPGTTQPTGLDLDQEKTQMNRHLSSLSDSTIRVYEYSDGKLGVDERLTFADRQGLLQYLGGLDAEQLYPGILYFINGGQVQDKATFAALKDFCIRHNVNLYVGEGDWSKRKPFWMDLGWIHDDAVWVVRSRP
jgi:hypothetical protein